MAFTAARFMSFILLTAFVQASKIPTGSTLTDLIDRDTLPLPTFFEEVFGPISASNNAPGLMASEPLDTYDVNACAQMCNILAFDDTNGPCIYFNIWELTSHGTPIGISCDMYNTVTDASTATTTGIGSFLVSHSRGFSRISLVEDGSFEAANPIPTFWFIFSNGLNFDFPNIGAFPGAARSGTQSCLWLFDPPSGQSSPSGSELFYEGPMNTVPGTTYIISLFHTMDSASLTNPPSPMIQVFWNNGPVLRILQNSSVNCCAYFNAQAEVVAKGNDKLLFQNVVTSGVDHRIFLDDVSIFEKWF